MLSPETVRTHVRNAMAKLGASTRSQAVALALQQPRDRRPSGPAARRRAASRVRDPRTADASPALAAMLDGLVSLYDVDGGAVYLADEDGLSLRRVAVAAAGADAELPESVALGDGALGRAALERRAQLLQDSGARPRRGALIAAPMLGGGRLLGRDRARRPGQPADRAQRAAAAAGVLEPGRRGPARPAATSSRGSARAMERFRASWSAAPRVA